MFTQLSAGKKETFIGTKLQIAKIDMHKSFKSGMWKMLQHLTNREQRGNCETPENNSSVSQPVSYDTKLSCRTVLMVMMMMMMGLQHASTSDSHIPHHEFLQINSVDSFKDKGTFDFTAGTKQINTFHPKDVPSLSVSMVNRTSQLGSDLHIHDIQRLNKEKELKQSLY